VHTSPQRTRGITLLELLIVIAVLVLLMGVGVAGLDRISGTELRTQTNRLAAAIRHAYNRSVAEGLYVRLVLMPETDQYRVEASAERVFIDLQADEESEEKPDPRFEDDEKPQVKPPKFELLIPQIAMTRGIGIDGVLTSGREDIAQTGNVSILFFPSGFVQPAMIYTTDGKDSYFTLTISPMTGRVKRNAGRVDPDRNFGEPDLIEEEGR
jgi:type II secretory pathway pseudopilin PulG